ncbi:hypothetical protein Ple7327_2801 [Pleurocapsa sp. PCC 7327]|nr:hypothetical protein Ple7327_2801 [Pleurocapsa sp. PCC 7327]
MRKITLKKFLYWFIGERAGRSLYHFSKVMTEMVDCPHPQPLSQFGRGEKDVDRD